jgi:hypothetical protein
MKKGIIYNVLFNVLFLSQSLSGQPGCWSNTKDLKGLDYKEWHLVTDCDCPCEASYDFGRKDNSCPQCGHKRINKPINYRPNFDNMPKLLQKVNIKKLEAVKRK